MNYKCRHKGATEWMIVAAPSPSEAANNFMFENHSGCLYMFENGEQGIYSLVEVEDNKTYIARCFWSGIGMYGGVKSILECSSKHELANRLGVALEDLEQPFEHEEILSQKEIINRMFKLDRIK